MSVELAHHCKRAGIKNNRVLQAITDVPRAKFVPKSLAHDADSDIAIPIGFRQTISQPYVVARMTELLICHHNIQSVLEVGTGSGYQAAILSHCVEHVYSIERIKALHKNVKERLAEYNNVHLLFADGNAGWVKHAPFDGIIITAATSKIPNSLIQQLSPKGRMVLPLGTPGLSQRLCVVNNNNGELTKTEFESVRFVPLLKGKTDT